MTSQNTSKLQIPNKSGIGLNCYIKHDFVVNNNPISASNSSQRELNDGDAPTRQKKEDNDLYEINEVNESDCNPDINFGRNSNDKFWKNQENLQIKN